MKTRRFTITSAVLLLAVALTGCGKPGEGGDSKAPLVGTAAGKTSTSSTVEAIQALLKSEKSLEGASITAKEASGSISLEGTVKSQEQKDKAESIVTTVQKEKGQQTGVLDNLMIETK